MNEILYTDGLLTAPRLNPFSFPSETRARFLLLILSVLGATVFFYSRLFYTIHGVRSLSQLRECFRLYGSPPSGASYADVIARADGAHAVSTCMWPVETSRLLYIAVGVMLVSIVTVVVYGVLPLWKIWRERLVPLSYDELPTVADALDELVAEAGLTRSPTLMWNPLQRTASAAAFGSFGHYRLAMSGCLVQQFYSDPDAFRAVVRHELAHLRNADVDIAYLTVSVWPAFLVCACLPFVWTLAATDTVVGFSVAWRLALLSAVAYFTRNAVLREREFCADVRASLSDPPTGALRRVISALKHDRLPGWRANLAVHPSPLHRTRVVDDPMLLMPARIGLAFATGVVAMASLPTVTSLLFFLQTLTGQTSLPVLGSALIFAPLMVGGLGTALWRETLATSAAGLAPTSVLRLASALGAGMMLGGSLDLENTILTDGRAAVLLFTLAWGAGVVVAAAVFLTWVRATARAWMPVAEASESPWSVMCVGVGVAAVAWAGCLSAMLLIQQLGGRLVADVSTFGEAAGILAVLGSTVVQLSVTHPVVHLLILAVVLYPMASWLWRASARVPAQFRWAWIGGSPHRQTRTLPQVDPRGALKIAGIGGVSFCALLLLSRIALSFSVAEAVRSTPEFRMGFYSAQFVLSIALQVVVAFVAARLSQDFSAVQGLFASYGAGCIATFGLLILNIKLAGLVELSVVWQVFSRVIGYGSMAATFIAFATPPRRVLARRSPAAEEALEGNRQPAS